MASLIGRMLSPLNADSTLDEVVRADAADDPRAAELATVFEFLLGLGRALLTFGLPAQRLEEALARIAAVFGFEVDCYSTPTALVVTLSDGERQQTRLVRAEPGATDLERLCALHALVGRVERRELSPADASRRLERLVARPPRYGTATTLVTYALASAATAAILGGTPYDLGPAAGLGLLVGGLAHAGQRHPDLGRLLPALAAGLASVLTAGVGRVLPVQESVLLLSALIVLLPGFTLTVATMELATANVVSGTSRLVGGFATLVLLGFGAALGHRLAGELPGALIASAATPAPEWLPFVAYGAATVAFAIVMRAAPRDLPAILATGTLAVVGTQLGRAWLGPELGALVGATLVGLAAHAHARWFDRPALLVMSPAMFLLVPGSVGFLSVSSMLEADVGAAMQLAFRMILIATSLAAGVLVATIAIPPRRAL